LFEERLGLWLKRHVRFSYDGDIMLESNGIELSGVALCAASAAVTDCVKTLYALSRYSIIFLPYRGEMLDELH
jgi:hypothetical protein